MEHGIDLFIPAFITCVLSLLFPSEFFLLLIFVALANMLVPLHHKPEHRMVAWLTKPPVKPAAPAAEIQVVLQPSSAPAGDTGTPA